MKPVFIFGLMVITNEPLGSMRVKTDHEHTYIQGVINKFRD